MIVDLLASPAAAGFSVSKIRCQGPIITHVVVRASLLLPAMQWLIRGDDAMRKRSPRLLVPPDPQASPGGWPGP